MALHFIGMTAGERESAARLWGAPDFEHPRATWTVLGDIPGTDTVILGSLAFPVPKKWRKVRGAHE